MTRARPIAVVALVSALVALVTCFVVARSRDSDAPDNPDASAQTSAGPAPRTESTVTTGGVGPTTYSNPVFPPNFPDPHVYAEDGIAYAFSTNNGGSHVPVIRSTDLASWEPVGDALPTLPVWADPSALNLTWAPAVLARDDHYVLYYTTRTARTELQCIGRGVARTPGGPYVDVTTEPLVCQADLGGDIDPSPFVDDDGTAYLLWKSDGNCCGLPTWLWSQRLADDGLTLVGNPARLLVNDQEWEQPLIEGPAMVAHGGTYYLFYSANWWDTANYSVGYGVCATPLGPCTKPQRGPLFASAASAAGPGGEEFFVDHDGRLWMAYHAWTAPLIATAGSARTLRLQLAEFEDGVPRIPGPTVGPTTAG